MGIIKTILLTGATGYLGSALTHALFDRKVDLIVLKRSTSDVRRISDLLNHIKTYDVDKSNLETIFKNNNIDCIIHTAACYGRNAEGLTEIFNANLYFPLQILEYAIKSNVGYFINTDTSLPDNLNLYAKSKSQFAEILKMHQSVITSVNIKMEYFFGPGDDKTKFITYIIDKLLSGAASIDLSAGTQKRDFIYIEDVVAAYLRMLDSLRGFSGFSDVQVGSGVAVSLRDVVEKLKDLTQNTSTILNFGALETRPGEVMYSKADTSFLHQHTAWRPSFTLEEGLKRTVSIEKRLYDYN